MATHKDWVQRNHEALLDQATQTVDYLTVDVRKRLGLDGDTPVGQWYDTVFLDKYNIFKAAFNDWRNPSTRTKVFIKVLEDEQDVFVAVYRILYTGALRQNPLVTDADLISMGLPPHSSGHSKHSSAADDYPWSKAKTGTLRHLIIDYGSSETSHAKPKGQHGAEFVYVVSDERPADISKLIHTAFDTRSPLNLEFTEEERGKHFWYAVRWENTRGEKGPWSPILSAIIP